MQTQAIRQALESRLTLIQGPPGTGKTKTACSLILAAVKLRKNKGARSDGKVRSVFLMFLGFLSPDLLLNIEWRFCPIVGVAIPTASDPA